MLSVPSSTEPIVLQRKNCVSLYLQPPSEARWMIVVTLDSDPGAIVMDWQAVRWAAASEYGPLSAKNAFGQR